MKLAARQFEAGAAALTAIALLGAAGAAGGDEAAEKVARRRMQLLAEMQSLAGATKVALQSGESEVKLHENAVFRYDDQPRRFIDATMWIWTAAGRPVACQKIEAKQEFNTGEPLWGYCFTSLSTEKLAVEWVGRKYRSTEPGIAFRPLAGAPAPAAGNSQRKRQARELARRFSGRILQNPRTGDSTEMRLLPTPIFEYADSESKVLSGVVFGFETNGTNPDLLVLLEVRGQPDQPIWEFAPARMTTGGITLKYEDENVWEAPFVSPHDGPFANWLFFRTSRTPVPDEVAP